MDLDDKQKAAFNRIIDWFYRGNSDLALCGPAGSGKTLLISLLAEYFGDRVAVLSPTAKAASNLTAKGIPCRTVHSQCMSFIGGGDDGLFFTNRYNDDLPSVAIVDEASMVCEDMYRAVHSNVRKVLWVGDSYQLDAVGRSAKVLRRKDIPRIELETIHRQDFFSSILDIATSLRTTGKYGGHFDERSTFATRARNVEGLARYAMLHGIDVSLCHSNRLRNAFNKAYRELLGYRSPIVDGERLVCLRNDYDRGIFNGQFLDPAGVVGGCYFESPLRLPGQKPTCDGKPIEVDYAHCLTVYKSQGSEFPRVLFIDHELPEQSATKLRYTGCSRAREQLHVARIVK